MKLFTVIFIVMLLMFVNLQADAAGPVKTEVMKTARRLLKFGAKGWATTTSFPGEDGARDDDDNDSYNKHGQQPTGTETHHVFNTEDFHKPKPNH
ncbi:hypothetical protein M5689_005326 [Euphorbia peplus]|nr:hypothetical protein M5689_005326 [Euphorbia peplus]